MNQKYEPRFLVDFMLGRLAKWLRIFGNDTLYTKEKSRPNIILQSLIENRILVTRDHTLSRKRAWKLVLIKSDKVEEQLKQLLGELNLKVTSDKLFSRCTICNGTLERLKSKEEIKTFVPEYVYKTQNDFSRCTLCKKIYWLGTHRDLLLKDLQRAGIKL